MARLVDLKESPRRGTRLVPLLGLIMGLALGATVLELLAGLPHLPAETPTWTVVLDTLRGDHLSLELLAYVLSTVAWLLWCWITISLLFRLLITSVSAFAHGAVWIRQLHAISDRITPSVVRHLVDSAAVALFVANLVSQSTAAAAAPSSPAHMQTSTARPVLNSSVAHWTESSDSRTGADTEYVVQPGDTLWAIAERYYGEGEQYSRLMSVNAGRLMPDGRRFTKAGVIYPGWVLIVPPLTPTPGQEETVYVVQPGDSLRSIAARLLGDETRWPEIFTLNHGTAKLPDGRTLTDPDLIWPGLTLKMPQRSVSPQTDNPTTSLAPQDSQPSELRKNATPPPTSGRDNPRAGEGPIAVNPSEDRLAHHATFPPTSTPIATVSSTPAVVSEPSTGVQPKSSDDFDSALIYGGVGLAVAALTGGATLLGRRIRRSLDEPPVRLIRSRHRDEDDFADHDRYSGSGGDADLAIAAAEYVQHFLVERGAPQVSVLLVATSRNTVTIVLSDSSNDQLRLLKTIGEFSLEVSGKGDVSISPDHDIVVRLSSKAVTELISTWPAAPRGQLCLIPVGQLPSGEALYVNWSELGHVLVAGLPGVGAGVVLTSLVTSLAARCTPRQLRLWAIAEADLLPAQLRGLPHDDLFVDGADECEVERTLGDLRAELSRRMNETASGDQEGNADGSTWPEILLVIGETATVVSDTETLELLGVHGPSYGIRLLAASTKVTELGADFLSYFSTRLVLQLFDDDESIKILGRPDAADLGMGEFLLRINRRTPVSVRGYRVDSTELEELIYSMRGDDGSAAPGARTVEDTDEPRSAPPEPDQVSIPLEPAPSVDNSTPKESDEEEQESDAPEAEIDPTTDALIQIRSFGDFVVTSGDREIVPSGEEGASYKAWEVLAFLAAQPDGSIAKDRLLAAVWPDVDGGRAAGRLRVAMTRLRALLAQQVRGITAEVVRTDRDGTCRLDNTVVTSDVQQFVSLCQASTEKSRENAKHSMQRAVEFYQGDLLSGRGTRFYEWVDERDDGGLSLRERYRESFYHAAKRLAVLHIEEGRPDLAVPLLKNVLRFEPTLEDIVRQLYQCYGQRHDLRSLIQEDRNLRQALRQIYYDPSDPEDEPGYYEPEPETTELFNQIRAELDAEIAVGGIRGK